MIRPERLPAKGVEKSSFLFLDFDCRFQSIQVPEKHFLLFVGEIESSHQAYGFLVILELNRFTRIIHLADLLLACAESDRPIDRFDGRGWSPKKDTTQDYVDFKVSIQAGIVKK